MMGQVKKNIVGEKLYPPVDTSNDLLMVREGLRVPKLSINRKEWEKTPKEKEALKRAKHKYSPANGVPIKETDRKLLVVHFENGEGKSKFRTTESIYCQEADIISTIERIKRLYIREEKKIIIRKPKKVYFNGKVYKNLASYRF